MTAFNETSLILLTNTFPHGHAETFLENELPRLSRNFRNIYILPTSCKGPQRPIPENVTVENCLSGTDDTNLLAKGESFFKRALYQEIFSIRNVYRLPLSPLKLKQCLSSLARAKWIASKLEDFIINSQMERESLVCYSYWADEQALGLAVLKKRLPNIKAITRGHGWDIYFERRNTGFIPYRSLLFTHLDAVFFISRHGLDYTANKFPEHVASFRLSRLGTLQGEWIPKLAKTTPLHVVSVSNLIPLKRVNLIIEALEKLSIPINWTHFGEGPERGKLEKYAQEVLEEKANISWVFEGQVSNTAILAFYRKQQPHLFINVSTTEGLPVSIMEAIAHSIPVIATDVGGTHEIVRDGKNGFLLPADLTVNQLAKQIEDFYNLDTEFMNAMRKTAYQTWSQHFNAELNFQLFAKQLLQL